MRHRILSAATVSASPRDGTAMVNLTAKMAQMRAQMCAVSQIGFALFPLLSDSCFEQLVKRGYQGHLISVH